MRRPTLSPPLKKFAALALISLATAFTGLAAETHFPSRFTWETVAPEDAGFDGERLAEAVAVAREHARTEPADLRQVLLDTYTGREPNYRVLGPTETRESDA